MMTTTEIDSIVSAELPNKEFDPIAYDAVSSFMMHGSYNCFVVPHNVDLIIRYQAHINVEVCNNTRAIKYLFKYINKGLDRARVIFEESTSLHKTDEIKNSLDCRYLSAYESYWRLFEFPLHHREPSVQRLLIHLPEEHNIYFSDRQSIPGIISNLDIEKTMFIEWMVTNKIDERGRSLLYADFPTKFTWYQKYKKWEYRKNGELYYLRLLLNEIKGATSYEDLRTINGITYTTYKETCFVLGILGDDSEWLDALTQASHWATGAQLRQLFVTIILFCDVTNKKNIEECFFVYGRGGTGKTFLWTTIINGIRSEGKIVLAVGSSGIASLLLPGAPMIHRKCLEALNRTLQDIHSETIIDASTKPFGGKTILLGGDFRQILPVIKNGTKIDIINATITQSQLWKECKVFKLETNMRLHRNDIDEQSRNQISEFSQWILQIGDGAIPSIEINDNDNEDEHLIEIPKKLLVENSEDAIQSIIDYSSTSMNAHEPLYSTEFLNTLKFTNVPDHELNLKLGCEIMLMRNISQGNGLCNGTRLIVTQIHPNILEAKIISGSNIGDKVYIPRIIMAIEDKKLPFVMCRKQFPVRLSYAMTINKSQGQTLDIVGLFLPKPVFTHGQLYVALSRVTSATGLKILILDDNGKNTNKTKNVIYKEIFDNI
ncbi:DNA helicase protein [Dioscorea alata]|uniref:DNA helicase protein n=1 Tax=Dioscorea alata TaxID=55571 RepID=A0ACB7UYJ0_DIOAL|nr:DNA helicase protein [Dioscorea alata]